MDHTDNTQYSMLVNISQEIGELKGDIKSTNKRLEEIENHIDESFDALVKKQDFLRDSLEAEIGGLRSELKDAKADIKRLSERVEALELKPQSKVYELFLKFKGSLIAAIIALVVGYCMSMLNTFLASLKQ